ncbi:MAG: TrmH family RNA methyltransferase [Verrucomicrobia bacterium]|nr:TrmH family RNA methyltransferase [Verrucomicrobiota bacterium]
MKLKRYDKAFDYSYAVGMFPTLELLEAKPELVLRVVLHSKCASADAIEQIESHAARHGFPVEQNDRLIDKLCPKRDCLVIGVFKKYASRLDAASDHVVLVNPSNAGNLGTVMRSMLAFGFHDLAVIEPAVDVFGPSTIRSSMGAVFGIRVEHFAAMDNYRTRQPAHRLYPFMTTGKHALDETTFTRPLSVVFGNESSGLPEQYEALGESVRIAQSPDVDSLNLAITTGIALHHLYRSRHAEVENPRHVSQA